MKKSASFCVIVWATLAFSPFLHAFENSRWDSARRHAAEGDKDFAYLELAAFARENPSDPRTQEAAFGIAEYRFENGQEAAARESFAPLAESRTPWALLAGVYLVLSAEARGDTAETERLAENLRSRLASERYVQLFGPKKTAAWTSPLGNRFEFRESVDRLEILRNGAAFYVVQLL